MFPPKMTKVNEKSGMKEKLISLPNDLMESLDADAKRCKRSVVKQIEAILSSYFEVENIEVNQAGINNAQEKNHFLPRNTSSKVSNQTGKTLTTGDGEKLKLIEESPNAQDDDVENQ